MAEHFTKQAAKASWIIPLVNVGMMTVGNAILKNTGSSPIGQLILGGVVILLFTIGIILGIIGLFGLKTYGAKSTTIPGIIGIILNSLLLSLLLFIAFSAFQKTRAPRASVEIGYGSFQGSIYHNEYFGMTITLPSDWSIQDKESQQRLMDAGAELTASDDKNVQALKKVNELQVVPLFTVFKHPLGAAVEYNPGITCIAERVNHLPGIKRGQDYLFHVKKGLESGQLTVEFPQEIYSEHVTDVQLDVLEVESSFSEMIVRQEYYATIMKGYALGIIISFTTEEERNELRDILATLTIQQTER